MSGDCPAETDLIDLLRDRLRPDRLRDLVEHIEHCPACVARLDALTGTEALGWLFDAPFLSTDPGVSLSSTAGRREYSVAPTLPPAAGPPYRVIIDGFEIHEELGRGGHGVVFRATQLSLNRQVALKLLKRGGLASQEETQRFVAEALAAARLKHPGIVEIHESGSTGLDVVDGQPWFAMELLEGGTLAERCTGRPVQPRAAARLVERLARGVAAAHSVGVVHRDLKPGNILFAQPWNDPLPSTDAAPWPEDAVVKISDFGLAKQLDAGDGPTPTVAIRGTPAYMAPEQAVGETRDATPLVDVYSLGTILYELLTGRPAFRGPTLYETLVEVREREPVPPRTIRPGIPRDIEVICLKCLEKQPLRRFGSAQMLADDLGRFVRGEAILARPPEWPERVARWGRRHRLGLSVGSLCLLLLAGWGVMSWLVRLAEAERQRASAAAVQGVLRARPADLAATLQAARAVEGPTLDSRLHEAFEFSSNLAERARVACAVREPSAEQLGFLVRWLEELKPDECPVVMGRLREGLKRTDVDVAGLLRGERPSRGPNLRLWLTLCYLGEEEPVAAVLQPGTDPKPRAALTEGLAEWWPGGALVAETLARTRSPDVRSALCCGLAEFPIGRLTEEELRLLRGELERQYREAPDGATHGAAGLALRRLGGTLPVLPTAQRPAEGRDWFVDRFGQTLVRLPAGEFTMGMEPGTFSHAIQSESIAHRVTIAQSFYIAATEVTRGNFEAFLADPHRRLMDQFEYAIWRNKWNLDNDRISPTDRHPIQNVRWRGALLFCDWLSRLDGRRSCYRRFDRARLMPMGGTHFGNIRGYLCDPTADGYRLPTEEEWEYACRAGAATEYSFGDLGDGDNDRVRSKYSHIGGRMAQPVGSLLPNRWGLFDLHGNVCEWCWNGDRVYSREPYLAQVSRVSGLKIVHRGGSWDLGLRWAMAGYRGPGEPNHDYDHNMGFRVVCGERREEPVAEEEPGPRGGFVFHDFRGDGQFDDWQEDAPLEGLEVYVDLNRNGVRDADEPTTTSNERGEFDFPGLPAGEYVVRSVPLEPWIVREGATPWRGTPVAPLRAGEVTPGMTSPAVLVVEPDGTRRLPTLAAFTGAFLQGDVFVDRNNNSQRDPGEPGIAGATLTITGPHDDTATFTTGADGKIRVWRIPGPQQAVVDLPDGYKWGDRAHKSQQPIIYSQPPPALQFPCREVE